MTRQLDHDRLMAALAAARHGVLARRVLLEHGIPAGTIDDRVRQRRLVQLHRGVYAFGHAELRREGRWLAAVEAYGPSAALSHVNAATLWDLLEGAVLPVHVTLGKRSGVARRLGTVPHRVLDLRADEVVERDAIRVTTVARTILDLAATIRGRRLEQVVRRASRLRHFDLLEQRAVLQRHPRQRGAPELNRLLIALHRRGADDFRSQMEVAFAQLCDDYGLPRPVINGIVCGERVDFHWKGTMLIVETDGFAFHSTPTAFADDRRRDQKLMLAGYTVARFTWHQVNDDAGGTARTISALLSRLRSS
jgi:Protein of unknown function (DUF559)